MRVGIIGSGMMGKNHADALRRIPGVEVVTVADPYAQDLDDLATRFGVTKAYSDYKEMCQEMKLDVLHNCTPNREHFAINKYAIEQGIGIYSEKPLAVTIEEADELCRLLEEHPVPNGVNFNYRSNAVVREMRARIRNGEAGKVLLVHGAYLQDWLMYETDFNWRLDSSVGGASRTVADIGSHWFDTVQVVLDKKITEVYAKLLTVYPTRLKAEGKTETFASADTAANYTPVAIDTEDAGVIMVKFSDGTFGTVTLSQVSGGYKNALELSVDCANYSLRWEQEEADHMLVGDRTHGVTKVYASAGAMTDDANDYAGLPGGHPTGWADALKNNIKLFYDAIMTEQWRNDKQEYATFREATYIMRIVEACLKSDEENKWMTV